MSYLQSLLALGLAGQSQTRLWRDAPHRDREYIVIAEPVSKRKARRMKKK